MGSHRRNFLRYIGQTSETPVMLEIKRAEGVYIYDINDRSYIDFISGISVSNLGHSHPDIVRAVKDQADRYMHQMVYGEFILEPQVKLAENLANHLPSKLSTVYFVNSGSEAVEGAIKLAKRFTGRTEIISFRNAYHGSTHGALSVMGNEEFKNSFRPLIPGVKFLDFNEPDQLEEISVETACVLVEPIQGEAGIILPENKFLEKLRKRCTQTGAQLIFDEIQTGFGRTGKLFALDLFRVVPDILTMAKGLGGGMPIGAFAASHEMMSMFKTDPVLGHITTFGGHPVSCAASLASLKILTEGKILDDIPKKEKLIRSLLKHPGIRTIRGTGLFLAMELSNHDQVKRVISTALSKGLIVDWFLFRNDSIRIAPPLIISLDQITEAIGILLESIEESSC